MRRPCFAGVVAAMATLVATPVGTGGDVASRPITAAPSADGSGSVTLRCGKWAVPARIAGKAVCLRDERRCDIRLAAQYRRYGFNCRLYEGLVTRWDFLRSRPLTELRIAPGERCPVTTETGRVGQHEGLGPGPAHPIGISAVVTMRMPPPEGWGSEWSGTKRVWLLDSRYAGRALIRGRQLDGPNEVRFVLGVPGFTPEKLLNPVREQRIVGTSPSLTRVRAPGCYAYQVDTRTRSYLVVFEARLAD
jgi:hypothetical protein